MWYTNHAEDVTVLKRSEDVQPSKMKFARFMSLYTALSLKCLDSVLYLPVIGVYSEDEFTVRGTGTVFSTDYVSLV